MTNAVRNERGMALLITIMVVAVLTIIVTEFTFSTQVNGHMVRTTFNRVRTEMLARSGINWGEATLLHDQQPNFDSFYPLEKEDWCLQPEYGGSCRLGPERQGDMELQVLIFDDDALVNLNAFRPVNLGECSAFSASNPDSGNDDTSKRLDVLASLLNADSTFREQYRTFWDKVCTTCTTSCPQGTPQTCLTSCLQTHEPINLYAYAEGMQLDPADFDSLQTRARADPLTQVGGTQGGWLNANTVTPEILTKLVSTEPNGPDCASEILETRATTPYQTRPGCLASLKIVGRFFGVRTRRFRISASALVNPGSSPTERGFARTIETRVERVPRPCPQGAQRQACWRLVRSDWRTSDGDAAFLDLQEDEQASQGSPSGRF